MTKLVSVLIVFAFIVAAAAPTFGLYALFA